jgi:hypothetical protein
MFHDVVPGVMPYVPAEVPAFAYVSPRGPVGRGRIIAADATMRPSSGSAGP